MDKFIKVISENNLYKYELNLENNDTKLLINEFKRKNVRITQVKGEVKNNVYIYLCIYVGYILCWLLVIIMLHQNL